MILSITSKATDTHLTHTRCHLCSLQGRVHLQATWPLNERAGNDRQAKQVSAMCKVIASWRLSCIHMFQASCRISDVSRQRTTYIPGLEISSPKKSESASRDHDAGTHDSLFVQTEDQAHSTESAVVTAQHACAMHAQGTVYT